MSSCAPGKAAPLGFPLTQRTCARDSSVTRDSSVARGSSVARDLSVARDSSLPLPALLPACWADSPPRSRVSLVAQQPLARAADRIVAEQIEPGCCPIDGQNQTAHPTIEEEKHAQAEAGSWIQTLVARAAATTLRVPVGRPWAAQPPPASRPGPAAPLIGRPPCRWCSKNLAESHSADPLLAASLARRRRCCLAGRRLLRPGGRLGASRLAWRRGCQRPALLAF